MSNLPHSHILAKPKPQELSLVSHLEHVLCASVRFAKYCKLDTKIARLGAIFHDLGKASTVFQERLVTKHYTPPFRHEIASLFFLDVLPKKYWHPVIEMVVGHHKSVEKISIGTREHALGIIDLEDSRKNNFEIHAQDFDKWAPIALDILEYFGISRVPVTREHAEQAYYYVYDYCKSLERGWSAWKGLLVGADHFASAATYYTENLLSFKKPNLSFYRRRSRQYPLSLIRSSWFKRHTLIVAPTGSGKTDFLLKRCKGRVFYTLPFQASINAMHDRIQNDLQKKNKGLDIRLLHGSSKTKVDRTQRGLQSTVGAQIKILTPFQIASLIFCTKDFESTILDIKGADIIFDEIHTYSGISQAIVLKLLEVLLFFGCRIHIGSATISTKLYEGIVNLIGKKKLQEVRLKDKHIAKYNRHIIYKDKTLEELKTLISTNISAEKKVLIVCNTISYALDVYGKLSRLYPDCPKMILHSRFRRMDRVALEKKLQHIQGPFILVSTQVIEVSLDLNFDLLITEAAPIDSLIQRFGRVNRRALKYKKGLVYILPPKAKPFPYKKKIVEASYAQFIDGENLKEVDLQKKIDTVYTEESLVDEVDVFSFKNNNYIEKKLRHYSKAILLKALKINTFICILRSDKIKYLKTEDEKYEIPVSYFVLERQIDKLEELGQGVFVIPVEAYCEEQGLLAHLL